MFENKCRQIQVVHACECHVFVCWPVWEDRIPSLDEIFPSPKMCLGLGRKPFQCIKTTGVKDIIGSFVCELFLSVAEHAQQDVEQKTQASVERPKCKWFLHANTVSLPLIELVRHLHLGVPLSSFKPLSFMRMLLDQCLLDLIMSGECLTCACKTQAQSKLHGPSWARHPHPTLQLERLGYYESNTVQVDCL